MTDPREHTFTHHLQDTQSPSRKQLGNRLLAIAIAMVIGLTGYLLGHTYLTQKRLQTSTLSRMEEGLAERARDLGFYLAERKIDIRELAASAPIETYFSQRAANGPNRAEERDHLNQLYRLFEQRNTSPIPGRRNIFDHIILFDPSGTTLVSCKALNPCPMEPWNWSTIAEAKDAREPIASLDPANPEYLVFRATVTQAEQVVGYIAGWIPLSALHRQFLQTEASGSSEENSASDTIHLAIDDTPWFPKVAIDGAGSQQFKEQLDQALWQPSGDHHLAMGEESTHFLADKGNTSDDVLVIAARLPQYRLQLIQLFMQQHVIDPQAPLRLLLSMGLISTATLVIFFFAVQHRTKAEVLQARLHESRRQQKDIQDTNARLQEEVEQRRQAERQEETERQRLELVVYAADIATWEWYVQTGETSFNQRWASILGYTLEELAPISIATWQKLCHPDDLARSAILLDKHFAHQSDLYDCECRMRHKDGRWVWVHDRGRVVEWNLDGSPRKMYGTHTDINRRKEAELAILEAKQTLEQRVEERTQDLTQLHSQMVMREKMASIGQLAAGLAHEINNPINFIRTNFATLVDNFKDIEEMLQLYRQVASEDVASPKGAELKEAAERLNIDFLLDDIPHLLADTEKGFERVGKIIQAMREFSRAENSSAFCWANVNKGIEDTLTIARNEYRYHVDIEKDFEDLPDILCIPEQLNQVFLNLIVNSSQALAGDSDQRGTIKISTRRENDQVVCRFWDNGPGIPEELRHRLFEPFFTTKPPGQGTGLGLSISYDIVVHKHGGELLVECPDAGGTQFTVRLPIEAEEHAS